MRIPQTPPPFAQLTRNLGANEKLNTILEAQQEHGKAPVYYHWDDLRYRAAPHGFSREEWWLNIKLQRVNTRRSITLADQKGHPFGFVIPDTVTELLHQIDRTGGTSIGIPEPLTNPAERDRYRVRSLMEEAITSSQLEGAAPTREAAKKMLTEKRAPRDRGERMIMNNFLTMQWIIEVKGQPLTPELVLDIHRRISEETLDIAGGEGRFRRADEHVDVSDIEGQVFHLPPSAAELPARMEAMCEFANAKIPDYFIHPVIRAIILHFWLAYDHPFVDGNGRTARVLFYWQMLHMGYWLFEFLSISQIVRKDPAKYGTAFLQTETDDNDLTYFIIHHADAIRRSLIELDDYVARKSRETRACMTMLDGLGDLNHRQQALLAHAVRHPRASYTIAGHMSRQGIVYDTARLDLVDLARRDLLEQRKAGRAMVFVAPADLEKRLRQKP